MGILAERVALVTGGSKGLGTAIARLLVRVVITFANDAEAPDDLAA
jgi:NAD(P)-dependent dehydrogenase (short-subunit alcohol dehydrogenase family)